MRLAAGLSGPAGGAIGLSQTHVAVIREREGGKRKDRVGNGQGGKDVKGLRGIRRGREGVEGEGGK